jgi:hypothetical protein
MIAFRTNSCVPRKAQVHKFEILPNNQNSLTPPPILSTVLSLVGRDCACSNE